MAFDATGLQREYAAVKINGIGGWSYKSTSDAFATIAASAYFNTYINSFTVGDTIKIDASDIFRIVRVTSVTTNVTVENITSNIPVSYVAFSATVDISDDATPTIAVTGVLATDKVHVQVNTSTVAVAVNKAFTATDAVEVVLSADPTGSSTLTYWVYRAVT